jgi:hypothetical protein
LFVMRNSIIYSWCHKRKYAGQKDRGNKKRLLNSFAKIAM